MKINVILAYDFKVLNDKLFLTNLKNTDVLIFPEMFIGGYKALKEDNKFVIHEDDEKIRQMQNISKEFNLTIIAGSAPIGTSFKDRKNTSLIFSKGKLIHKYEKMHLFRPLDEHKYFKYGKDFSNFNLNINNKKIACGVIICYDLRFPELSRIKTFEGMKILFIPAWWPKERDEIWRTLLKARAIENQIFVVGVNSGDKLCGKSYVFAPNGDMLFEKKENATFDNVTLDLNKISEIKKFVDLTKEARIVLRVPH